MKTNHHDLQKLNFFSLRKQKSFSLEEQKPEMSSVFSIKEAGMY